LFNAHGYKYFEKLDIWEDETLLNNFIKETNRRPRVEIPNKLLLKLNKIKNNIKNAFKL
jgi:hypothetical protein